MSSFQTSSSPTTSTSMSSESSVTSSINQASSNLQNTQQITNKFQEIKKKTTNASTKLRYVQLNLAQLFTEMSFPKEMKVRDQITTEALPTQIVQIQFVKESLNKVAAQLDQIDENLYIQPYRVIYKILALSDKILPPLHTDKPLNLSEQFGLKWFADEMREIANSLASTAAQLPLAFQNLKVEGPVELVSKRMVEVSKLIGKTNSDIKSINAIAVITDKVISQSLLQFDRTMIITSQLFRSFPIRRLNEIEENNPTLKPDVQKLTEALWELNSIVF